MKNYELGDKVTIQICFFDRKTFEPYYKSEEVEILSYIVNIKDTTQKKYYKLSNGMYLGDIKNSKAHGLNTSCWIDIYSLKG